LPLPGIEPRSSGRPARSQTLYMKRIGLCASCIDKFNYANHVVRNDSVITTKRRLDVIIHYVALVQESFNSDINSGVPDCGFVIIF
jgi:hypothetical protein